MSGEPRDWLPATIQWALRRGGGFVCASEVADIKNAAQALSAECARQDAEIDRLQAELEQARGAWITICECDIEEDEMAMLLLFSGEKVLGRRVFHGKQAAWYGPSGMRQWLEGSGGVTHYCPIVFPPDPPESEANDVW